jgi:hypothetical protein
MEKKEENKSVTNNETELDRRIKVMVDKIGSMENSIKNERIIRVRLEEENKDLKDSILIIQKQLEEKASLN